MDNYFYKVSKENESYLCWVIYFVRVYLSVILDCGFSMEGEIL